jgi:hypothetical protein
VPCPRRILRLGQLPSELWRQPRQPWRSFGGSSSSGSFGGWLKNYKSKMMVEETVNFQFQKVNLTKHQPGANVIKFFTAVIYEKVRNKLECLSLASLSSLV